MVQFVQKWFTELGDEESVPQLVEAFILHFKNINNSSRNINKCSISTSVKFTSDINLEQCLLFLCILSAKEF